MKRKPKQEAASLPADQEKHLKDLEKLVAEAKKTYQEKIETPEEEITRETPAPKEEKARKQASTPSTPLAKKTPTATTAPKPKKGAAGEEEIPLTKEEAEAAQKLPLSNELRWLGEWCSRQWRKLTPGEFNDNIRRSLQMSFLEVLLPRDNEIEPSAADQMFANLAGLYKKGTLPFKAQHYLSLELVAEADEIKFVIGTPQRIKDFVIQQIHSFYPTAEIFEIPEYNIFEKEGEVTFAELTKTGPAYYPIMTYEDLPVDAINSITQTLSNLEEGSSAAIQMVISPAGKGWQDKGQGAIHQHKNPGSKSSLGDWAKIAGGQLTGNVPQESSAQKEPPPPQIDEKFVEGIQRKISKQGFGCTIRVVVTASDRRAARTYLRNILTSFEQVSSPHFSSLKPKKVALKKHFMVDFLYRHTPRISQKTVLSTEELATIYHFPNKETQTPDIKWLTARGAPPPQNLPKKGIYLGLSNYRGVEKKVYLQTDDRKRHTYIIGQTGTGKTELIKHLVYQDIVGGKGLAFIDPHGDAIEDILAKIPPERADDVIYFDPGDTQYPPGLNILEAKTEEGKHLIINSFIALLYKLYDPNRQGIMGPQLERTVRNVMLTAMEEEGNSLIEVLRLLIDPDFAKEKTYLIKDPIVKMYWTKELARTSDFHKGEKLGYFVSKFDRFVTEKLMRNIIGQSSSSFDFREAMDEGKILLVNLSKGRIGEENSNFLGLILIPRILAAAMARADVKEKERRDFYLYVDEFQNFATPDFVQILSESRKYGLSLIVANQFIGQLSEEIKDAVFGNVGTTVCFRVGAEDAEYLESHFEPFFTKADMMSNPVGSFYTRVLISGQPSPPFSMKTAWEEIQALPKSEQNARKIIELSRQKYGRPVAEVEKEIGERNIVSPPAPTTGSSASSPK
jgi:hypothetical protein